MSHFELAQLNIAHLRAPLESAAMADFVANLDRINALAEAAPGYVWRLQTDAGDATAIQDFGADYIVNLSVWRDIDALREFVYRSAHTEIMSRRREWFHSMERAYAVLWWVPSGHRPDTLEAKDRLTMLERQGPTSRAFSFRHPFGPPGSDVNGEPTGVPA